MTKKNPKKDGKASGRDNTLAVLVDDPYEPGSKIEAVRRKRRIDEMWKRHELDEAQYAAGDRFDTLCIRATLCDASGIDYSQDRVDSSMKSTGIRDSVLVAMGEQAILHDLLGASVWLLLVRVCHEQMSVTEVARKMGLKSEYDRKKLMKQFKAGLDKLVLHWELGG